MVSSTLSPAHKSSVASKWNGFIRSVRESIVATSPAQLVDQVLSLERVVSGFSPKEMLQRSKELTVRARSEKKLARLIPDAFSLVREAAFREFGYRHYPVQILGGVHLAHDRIIEMETGQGKSITALFPLYLYGLLGKGAHLATSNDYLAERDAKTMANVFRQLGLSCGFVNGDMKPDQRRINYGYDITYGTGTEFGFDFLRDRIATPSRAATPSHVTQTNSCVQRARFFILADEADSLLIDDANTPLILGTAGNPRFALEELCHWAVRIAGRLILDHDYERSKIDRSFRLTRDGRSKVRDLANGSQVSNHYSMFDVFDYVEKAMFAHNCMH
ncbi:MAG: hypothetical protein ACK5T6_13810, partial [Pirellula sp.]